MLIRSDFHERVVVRPGDEAWTPSPTPGVERVMLDRVGGEVARATSLVRYAPGSRFPAHVHAGGEEFLVLDGVFSDETGDFPAGTYVRNPPGSSHAPYTTDGCTIFVKLRQFAPEDDARIVIDTSTAAFRPGLVPGLTVLPLHGFRTEHAAMVRWSPGTRFNAHSHWGGEEILVVAGLFEDEHGRYSTGTWIRSPDLSRYAPFSMEGCFIYVKTGHLGAHEQWY